MGASLGILVVDDQQEITALLTDVLGDAGYEVRVAADGISALAAVHEQVPALILLDNMMPGLSGRNVVRSLRAEGFTGLPIIMMSAATTAEPLLRAGATDFIAKPFSLDEVLDCVEYYIGVGQSSTAIAATGEQERAVNAAVLTDKLPTLQLPL